MNNNNDYSNALAICFPGGFAYYYKIKLSEFAINNIRNYVNNGGSYVGICAGAYFASSKVIWEGIEYDYPLNLFDGKAIGSLHDIAPWDNYKMTEIALNSMNYITKGLKKNWNVLYYGGQYFESNKTNYEIVSFWKEYNYLPAIINFSYGEGKVLLIGPHLEIEENSDRDSNNFASNLIDLESDWDLLYNLFQWLISKETKIIYENDSCEFTINNNVLRVIANDNCNLDLNNIIEIYNYMGILIHKYNLPSSKNINIDISNFANGIYFIKLYNNIYKFNILK